MENIALQILQIFYIIVSPAEIATIIGSKMVTISTRNTKIYKFYLLYFTTFRDHAEFWNFTAISILIIYMKKFLHSDWLRAVQFLGNTVPKKKFSAKKGNSVQISLDFKFLNFLTTHVYL